MGELISPGVKHFEEKRYCLSADVGQSQDPTAIAVVEQVLHTHETVKGKVLKKWMHYNVVHLARLPLGLSYPDQVEAIYQIFVRHPLRAQCDLVIDDTGVGRAVGDMFAAFDMKPLRVTITAGDAQNAKGANRWTVSKGILISILDAKLHSGEMKIAPALAEASVLKEELRDFRRNVSAAGRFTFEARSGRHDDLVLAVAMGLWNFVGRKKPELGFAAKYHLI